MRIDSAETGLLISLESHPCPFGTPQSTKMVKRFPSREGQGPPGLGVGRGSRKRTHPGANAPPLRGGDSRSWLLRNAMMHSKNLSP